MGYLVFTLSLPLFSPVVEALFSKSSESRSFLNGHIITFIPIVSFLLLLPEAMGEAGYISYIFLGLGYLIPILLDKIRSLSHENRDVIFLVITLLGMSIHDFLDGTAIFYTLEAQTDLSSQRGLQAALVLHRLPFGLFFYHFLKPHLGFWKSYAALFLLVLSTFLGYLASSHFKSHLVSGQYSGYLIMFIIGGFLHIIKHEVFYHRSNDYSWKWSFLGSFSAIILTILIWLF